MDRLDKYIMGIVGLVIRKDEEEEKIIKAVLHCIDKENRVLCIYEPVNKGIPIKFDDDDLKSIIVGLDGKAYRYDIFNKRVNMKNMVRMLELEVGEVYEYNRRRAYRVRMETEVKLKGRDGIEVKCHSRDISQMGLGIIGARVFEVGEEVIVTHDLEGSIIEIRGVIKRQENWGAGKVLYGIQYRETSKELTKLVYEEQKKELAKRKAEENKAKKWT